MRDIDQPLDDKINFRCWSWLKSDVMKIADREHRDDSDVARLLLLRGLAAYDKDKQLFEPKDRPK